VIRTQPVIVLVFLLSVQAQASYPTKQGVTDALKDAEYALRRFEDVVLRVDVNRWKVDDDLRGKKRETVRLLRSEVEDTRKLISRIERSQESVSGLDLLIIEGILVNCETTLSELSNITISFQDADTTDMAKASERSELALDLARASGTATESDTKLVHILMQQIAAEEEELAKCRVK